MNVDRGVVLARGVSYLLRMQDDSGGWLRSRYGALRGGAALTALACYALSRCGESVRLTAREPILRGVDFLRRGLSRRGCVAAPDGTLDLPVYATSLALLAEADDLPMWSDRERERMHAWLAAARLSVERGFAVDDPQLGGWDMGSQPMPRGVTTGTSVSHVAWALEALRLVARPGLRSNSRGDARTGEGDRSGTLPSKRILAEAVAWLDRCQNSPGDGGFVFAPPGSGVEQKTPMGMDGRPRGYATATCDGLWARLWCGQAATTPVCLAALRWLAEHPRVDLVPGFAESPVEARDAEEPARAEGASPGSQEPAGDAKGESSNREGSDGREGLDLDGADWSNSLWYYYVARRTRLAMVDALGEGLDASLVGWREGWRVAVLDELTRRQARDGSWSNRASRMREDDPLIASPLAILALAWLD